MKCKKRKKCNHYNEVNKTCNKESEANWYCGKYKEMKKNKLIKKMLLFFGKCPKCKKFEIESWGNKYTCRNCGSNFK